MSALADDWEDSDNDDWEAVADDLDNVNINEDSTNNSDKKQEAEAVLTTDEIFAELREKLVVDSPNLCRGLGVATGVKLRTSNAESDKILVFLVETLKILGPHLKYEDVELLKKLTSAKVKIWKAKKQAEEDRKKKAEELKKKGEEAPAKKKKKKKKKKKRVYSVYEDEDDPDLWDGLDESSERYHEALTHKSSKNFGNPPKIPGAGRPIPGKGLGIGNGKGMGV